MISAATANFIIALASLVFVYLVSITCIGFLQAFVAAKFGDTSAVRAGYLSGNPAVYFDVFGLISLLVFGLGWSRTFPFQPHLLADPFKKYKILLVYLMQPIVACVLALGAIIASVLLIGPQALPILYHYTAMHTIFRSLNMQALTELCGASSCLLLLLVIMISAATINIFLAAWGLVSSMWDHALYHHNFRQYSWLPQIEWFTVIAPMILFMFLFPPVHFFMLNFIVKIAYVILESIRVL